MEAGGGLGLGVTEPQGGSHPREPGCLPVGVCPLSRTLTESTSGPVGPQTQSSSPGPGGLRGLVMKAS